MVILEVVKMVRKPKSLGGFRHVKKVSISLPREMLEYVDAMAGQCECSRSEIIQWVLLKIGQDEELEEAFFGEEEEDEEEEAKEEE